MQKTLITYFTKTGTTKEIAEEIGKVFVEKGLEIDILELSEVMNIKDYSFVIIGAPIHGMRWVPDAISFIEENKDELNKVETAYFSVSYLIKDGRGIWKNAIKKSFNAVKKIVNPINEAMFGGKIESSFPSVIRLLFGVKKDAPLDVRDWEEIREWANILATQFS